MVRHLVSGPEFDSRHPLHGESPSQWPIVPQALRWAAQSGCHSGG